MRMLTLALLLASSISVPAYAQFRDHGHRDGGQEGMVQPVEEGRAARYERRAEAQASQSQPVPQVAPIVRGNHGNWNGAQSQPPSAPVAQSQPSDNRGGWGGNRNWQGRQDTMNTSPPQIPSEPHDRGWQGRWNGANHNDGRNWNGRPNGVPVPQDNQRHWDGDRNDRDGRWDGDRKDRDRRWDGNRNDTYGNQGGWHRDDNGRWGRRGDGDRDSRGWNNGYNHRDWDRDWRRDRRYDWRGYRNEFRDRYRVPRYYSPYGYNYRYQRFGIGIYLNSLFYGSRYWLSDPWEYRLPAAPYGCRWVRYYDDVLLVDVRSGYVVDVIYDFFW